MKLNYDDFKKLKDDDIVIKSYILIIKHLVDEKLTDEEVAKYKIEELSIKEILQLAEQLGEKKDPQAIFLALALYHHFYKEFYQAYLETETKKDEKPDQKNRDKIFDKTQLIYRSMRDLLDLDLIKDHVKKYLFLVIQQLKLFSKKYSDNKELSWALTTLNLNYQQLYEEKISINRLSSYYGLLGSVGFNKFYLQLSNVEKDSKNSEEFLAAIIKLDKEYQNNKDDNFFKIVIQHFILYFFADEKKALYLRDLGKNIKNCNNERILELYNEICILVNLYIAKAELFLAIKIKTKEAMNNFLLLFLQCVKEYDSLENYIEECKSILFEVTVALCDNLNNLQLCQKIAAFLNHNFKSEKVKLLSEWMTLCVSISAFRSKILNFNTSTKDLCTFLWQLGNFYEQHHYHTEAKTFLVQAINQAYDNLLKECDYLKLKQLSLTEENILLYIELPQQIRAIKSEWSAELADVADACLKKFYELSQVVKTESPIMLVEEEKQETFQSSSSP